MLISINPKPLNPKPCDYWFDSSVRVLGSRFRILMPSHLVNGLGFRGLGV